MATAPAASSGNDFCILRSSTPELNFPMRSCEDSDIERFMRRRFELQLVRQELIGGLVKECFAKFKSDWANASLAFKKHIAPYVKPEHYLLKAIQVFQIFVEDKLNNFLAECPEHEAILEQWNQCKKGIANLRYTKDSQYFAEIKKFIVLIQQKLLEYGDTNPEVQEEAFWAAWETILSNGDVIDLRLLEIHEVRNCDEVQGGMHHVVKAYQCILQKLNVDLIWFIRQMENELKPYPNTDLGKYILIVDKMRFLEYLRNVILRITTRLGSDELDTIIKQAKSIDELDRNLNKTIQHIYFPFANRFSRTYMYERIWKEEEKCPGDEEQLVDFKHYLDKFNANIPEFKDLLSFRCTRKKLKELTELFIKDDMFHHMWDTYFAMNFKILTILNAYLEGWQKSKSKVARTRAIELFAKERFLASGGAERKILSVDELLLAIQGDKTQPKEDSRKDKASKVKDTDKKKNGKKNIKDPSPPKEAPAIRSSAAATVSVVSVISSRQENLHPHSLKLASLIMSLNNEELRFKKTALRQTLLNFEDLLTLKETIKKPCVIQSRSLMGTLVWQTVHRTFEQMLRYTVLVKVYPNDPNESAAEHHLKYIEKFVKSEPDVQKIIDKVYLANFWVNLTYMQFSKRSQSLLNTRKTMPMVLTDAIELAERPSSEKSAKIMEELKPLIEDSHNAATRYVFEIPARIGVVDMACKLREVKDFATQWTPGVEHLKNVEKLAKDIVEKFPSNSDLPGVLHLKQLIKDINVLEGFFQKLNDKIPSSEFSLIVRNIAHFEHAAAQNCMRAILYFQTQQDTREHELSELYKMIKWNGNQSAIEEQFLSENFYDLHRLSFYPFEVKHPKCKLHEAVLAAEVLRERPDCDDGFHINAGKKAIDSTGHTPINYLAVNPQLLKAQAVVKVLNDAHTGLKDLFVKRFIPELKLFVT